MNFSEVFSDPLDSNSVEDIAQSRSMDVNFTGENDSSNSTDSEYLVDENEVLFQFITNGILLNIVGLLGIVGNIISMIILSRPQMKSSINYLLIGLARCDTVLIITSMLLFGLPAINSYTGMLFTYHFWVYPHLAPGIFPLATIAQTVSVYLTLTVTLERFVAVCHPLQARSLCTYGRARAYVFGIIGFSTLYNLSRFWEVECVDEWSPDYNMTLYSVQMTALRQNKLYVKLYINVLYLVFIYVVPFSSLAVLNALIYRQVRRANAERQRLSRLQKKEIGLATMLLCVVVVFFLCNILALVANVLEAYYNTAIDQLVKTSNLLVTINSSVNFVIYVIFGEKFKLLFFKLFCPQSKFFCASPAGGRDSPECDSVISNGDGRNYSVRSTHTHTFHLHRSGTSIIRNGGGTTTVVTGSINGSGNSVRSTRIPRAASFGPCVYYPARTINTGHSPDWDTPRYHHHHHHHHHHNNRHSATTSFDERSDYTTDRRAEYESATSRVASTGSARPITGHGIGDSVPCDWLSTTNNL